MYAKNTRTDKETKVSKSGLGPMKKMPMGKGTNVKASRLNDGGDTAFRGKRSYGKRTKAGM